MIFVELVVIVYLFIVVVLIIFSIFFLLISWCNDYDDDDVMCDILGYLVIVWLLGILWSIEWYRY